MNVTSKLRVISLLASGRPKLEIGRYVVCWAVITYIVAFAKAIDRCSSYREQRGTESTAENALTRPHFRSLYIAAPRAGKSPPHPQVCFCERAPSNTSSPTTAGRRKRARCRRAVACLYASSLGICSPPSVDPLPRQANGFVDAVKCLEIVALACRL